MSWLNKVTGIAERAESLLNRIDQNAADALKKPKAGVSTGSVKAFPREESQASLRFDGGASESGIEIGSKRQSRSHYGTSSVRSFGDKRNEDDELIAYLNEGKCDVGSTGPPSVASHVSTSKANRPTTPAPKMAPLSSAEELKAQHSDTLKSLHLKESEIAVIRVSLQESEEAVRRKEAKIEQLMRENELLRNDSRFHVDSNDDLATTLERLSNEKQRERENFEARENEYAKRVEKMREEKSELIREVESMRASTAEMEQRLRLQKEELRLAKYNLEANKHEFDEYKQKAQKILNAKEQLLASLKENSAEVGDGSSSVVELEELRCERELLKEDVQQAQLVIYNLKADIQDLENRLREEQKSFCVQRESLLEQNHRHLSAANQYREQMERTQLEYEFLQAEMRRQEEAVERKLAEKDVELMKLMEERKWGKKYEAGEAEQRLTMMSEKLIAKQTSIERLEGEKRALALRLERSERAHRQAEAAAVSACAIDMHDGNGTPHRSIFNASASDGGFLRVVKAILRAFDMLGLRLASFMRSPLFRIFFCIYCILLHSWVFFIILTYTPEIHPL